VNLVNLEAVGKAHGTTVVLRDVSLGVENGERIGVVGRNGGGKSTLLRVLARHEDVDSGRATHAGGVTVGRLGQHDTLPATATVLRCVVGDRDEHEWAGDARVRAVMAGLLTGIGHDATVSTLSGGERRRLALAALLVDDPALLLLDEPTNHLDLEAVAWLADWLVRRRGALVVVTHDRWFLDAVCRRTWEVGGGSVYQYDGGYAAYVLARAERDRHAAATDERRRNLMRKELAWLRRGPPARTSKPQFRIEAANALIADEPPPRDRVELQRFATARLGRDVFDLEDARISAGDRVLLDQVTWRLGPGDRVGLLGPNGAGKTTLLRTLSGESAPAAGRLRTGRTVVPAYLSQDVAELDPALRVLEAVEQIAARVTLGKGREATASQLLERLGFAAARQWTPVGDLSGGERRRLQLLRLLMAGPNVMLLDEPTNDLDVETLAEVEDVLDGWAGTLVVVSHDRWFLERVCDDLYAIVGGTLRHLPGGVDEYLAIRAAAGTDDAAARSEPDGAPRSNVRADPRAARKELARIERRLSRIATEEAALHESMTAVATDHEKVLALDAQLRALAQEKATLEEQWLLLADDVD
jgi:ABC transport system ATP-binding/permease protein